MFNLGKKNLNKNLILILRQTKSFIKSRYSRGRQWSKAIVFFGLWFNIGSVLGSFFFCYQYTLRFSQWWWVMFFFINVFLVRLFIQPQVTPLRATLWLKYTPKIYSQDLYIRLWDYWKIYFYDFSLEWEI